MYKLISVLIPCYNCEKYIGKCLDSVLSQTYDELEIIVVDDGSIDNTPTILAEYAQADERVVYIQQSNAGAGAALNAAIELSRGELMTFVDDDDWLEPTMYAQLYAAMTDGNADMAVCNFNLVYDDRTEYCYSYTNSNNEVVDVHKDVRGYFSSYCACEKPNNYTWTRLYQSDMIKRSGVRFENLRLGADTLFNFKLLPLMRRVAFIRHGLYNYVQHPASIVHNAATKSNIAAVYADGFDALADYYTGKGFNDFLEVLPLHAVTRLRSVYFYSRLAGMNDEAIKESISSGFAGRQIYNYLTEMVL